MNKILFFSDLAEIHYLSDETHRNIPSQQDLNCTKPSHGVPQEFSLKLPLDTKWYQWGAKYAQFDTEATYEEFFRIAGSKSSIPDFLWRIDSDVTGDRLIYDVKQVKAALDDNNRSRRYKCYWYSSKQDLMICSDSRPDLNEYYIHRIGVTGERKIVRKLLEWYRRGVEVEGCGDEFDESKEMNISFGVRDYV